MTEKAQLALLLSLAVLCLVQQSALAKGWSPLVFKQCTPRHYRELSRSCPVDTTHFCGFRQIRIPRGGYDDVECVAKMAAGSKCQFDLSCLSNQCDDGTCASISNDVILINV